MRKVVFAAFAFLLPLQAYPADTFRNGAPYFAEQDPDLPRHSILFSFHGGPAVLSPEQQGILMIYKELLGEGPSTLSLREYRRQLFDLGAEVHFEAEPNLFMAVVKAPPLENGKALSLLRQTLDNPRSGKEDFQRIHGKILAGLRANFENMRQVLFYFGPRDFVNYAAQARTGETSPSSFSRISYEDFKDAFSKIINYRRLFVSYIGPEAAPAVRSHIEAIFQDKMAEPYQPVLIEKAKAPKVEKTRYTVINKTGATDNQVAYIYPQTVARKSSEWVLSQINMEMLGGGTHGELGRILRAERGLTYAAVAFNSRTLPFWMAWTFGGLEQTKALLNGIPEVVNRFSKTKWSKSGWDDSKRQVVNQYRADMELPADRLRKRTWYYANGFPPSFADTFESDVDKVSLVSADQYRSDLRSKVPTVYIMGDKAKVLPMLESIGVARHLVRVVELSEIR